MKIKNSKKLSLVKETLKILNASDLARVHGADTLNQTVLSLEAGLYGFSTNTL